MLPKPFIQFPFAGGLDEKTERAYLDPGSRLAAVVNGNFVKVGAVDKRYGIGFLPNTVLPPNALPAPTLGQRVTSWNRSDLTVMGSSGLYVYSAADAKLAAIAPLPPCYPIRRPVNVAGGGLPPIVFDVPYAGHLLRVALSMNAAFAVYGTVYDADSGDIVLEPTLIYTPTAGYVPVIVNGFYLPNAPAAQQAVILLQSGSRPTFSDPQSLLALNYVPSTNSFSSTTTIFSAVSAPFTDAVPYVGDPQGGFVVQYASSPTTLQLDYLLPSFSSGASYSFSVVAGHSLQGNNCLVATYGEEIYANYVSFDGSTAHYMSAQFAGDHSLTPWDYAIENTSVTNLASYAGACRLSSTSILVTWQYPTGPDAPVGVGTAVGGWFVRTAFASSVSAHGTTPMGFLTAARPFAVAGVPYQVCIFNDQIQTSTASDETVSEQYTLYLMQWQTTSGLPAPGNQVLPVATIAKNVVGAAGASALYTTWRLALPSQTSLTALRFAVGLTTVGTDISSVSGSLGPCYTAEFFFDTEHTSLLYQAQELGSELHISGGVPFVCDSQIAFEDNFFYFPEFSYLTVSGTGCTLTGQYLYAVCYAYTDAAGLIHRSAPAYTDPVTPTPALPAVVTGTTNAASPSLYGIGGTLDPTASVTGSVDVTQASMYGANGALTTPIVLGSVDVTSTGLYGTGGTLDGKTLIISVDGDSPKTLTLSGASTSLNYPAFATAIQSTWPQLEVSIDSNNYLALISKTLVSGTIDAWQSASPGTACLVLGIITQAYNGAVYTGGQSGVSPPPSQGTHGQWVTSGSGGGNFTDAVTPGLAWQDGVVYGWYAVTVVGAPNGVHNNGTCQVIYVDPDTVNLTINSPVVESTAGDGWGLNGTPTYRVLSLNVGGAGMQNLLLDGAGTAGDLPRLLALIETEWSGLTATTNASGQLVLAARATGTSIIVGNCTAAVTLGLKPGTYSSTATVLTMTVNGLTESLTFDATGNAATEAAMLAAIGSKWTGNVVATLNADGNLVLTDQDPGSSNTIVISASSALTVLGLRVGTTAGVDGGGGPVLHITALSATWRDLVQPGSVVAEVYRTTSNGSIFYLLDRIPISGTQATEVLYPPTGNDNTPDTQLDTASLLYTTGGVLPNINPPTFLIQITHNGRVVGVDETLQQIWISQAYSPGTAPGFSGSLTIPFGEGGDITALASMDGKLFVFKESSIWVMYGNNGPALTGQGSDWTVPQRISTDVGAQSWQGCCSTDVGVFFQSATGIYLLGRDQSVSFIGKNVIDTLTSYPTITSATLVPSATQVRFTCSNGSSSVTIAYDYLLQQWTTHAYPYLTAPIASSCLTYDLPQQFTMVTADGKLWQENLASSAAPWLDQDSAGAWHFVPTSITLAWIKTQLQAYMRATFCQLFAPLQSEPSNAGLQIQLALNYNPIVVQTKAFPAADLEKQRVRGQVQMAIGFKFNQAMAYQFTVSDVDGGGAGQTGQGARFVSFGLDLEQLGARYPFLPLGAKR